VLYLGVFYLFGHGFKIKMDTSYVGLQGDFAVKCKIVCSDLVVRIYSLLVVTKEILCSGCD
jgi:hypothetical protein